jgi:histone-lysine N-methyltransferase SETMAR
MLPDAVRRKRPIQLARGVHPSYSPDVAPSDCHLFDPLRNHLGGKRFTEDETVLTEMRQWLRQQSKYFYAAGFHALVKRWNNCINFDGGYVGKLMFFPGSNITYFTFYIHLCPIY